MKPRSLRALPQSLVICFAPLLACAPASAAVLNYNEANTNGVWTVRAGTNLLAGATVVATSPAPADPAIPPAVQEGATSNSWATLTDGVLGIPSGTEPPYKSQTVAPGNGVSVIYALDLTGHPDGYDPTSFDSYCIWGDGNRDNQNFAIQFSSDGVDYYTIAVVDNRNSLKATHTSLTDTSGVLATGVKYVKFIFGSAPAVGQENGYVGYSEFILRDDPTNVVTLTESNATNGWTLPAGSNLLNGATATAVPASPSREGSATDPGRLTDGILGAPADIGSSLTPDNNTSIIFPLNTAVNFNGYNLTSIDTYCAWPNGGRDDQALDISYSVVGAESVFIPLGTAVVKTPNPGTDNSTHVRLTPASGFLASGVAAIKINTGHLENGFVGFREFIALGTAVSISDPLTWTGGSGSAGNANWTTSADSNWKKTIGGAAGNFSSLAALTFDNTGSNTNITVPVALAASSMAFTNDGSHPYMFGGGLITVNNDIVLSGAGTATFGNEMKATTGVTLSGPGNLVFNGALESTGVTVAGTGGITLNAANPALTGNAAVSDGTLTVSHDNGLQGAGLSMSGGTARFTSAAPVVASISSAPETPGTIVLGKTTGAVNTNLSVGTTASASTFGGSISQASGTIGSLTKTGASTLMLSGENSYTGTTTVSGGTLQFDKSLALYGGVPATWTAANLVVASGATLGFTVNNGGFNGEFLDADIDASLALAGFASGSFLGINSTTDVTLARNLTQPGLGLVKSGASILNLTGNNTSNGTTRIFGGTINAAGTGSAAINGNVLMGNGSDHAFLNMGGNNQLPATCVISFAQGNFYQSKINLRGTNQTIEGLDSPPAPANRVSLIQNDEIGQPGFTEAPGPATLTINATTDHSFYGLIRNQEGGAVSVIKNGPGTQEFRNMISGPGLWLHRPDPAQ